MFAVLVAFTLNALFMQRQDLLFILIGCVIIWSRHKFLRPPWVLATAAVLAISVYIVVGLGAVARFGWETLGTGMPRWLLPLWVIHGELTVPYKLGDYVVEGTDTHLLGRYSLGEYFTLTGSDMLIGAEYISSTFVGAQTAQSIAAPYSFALDFGEVGALVMGFVTGWVLGSAYRSFKSPGATPFGIVAYPWLFLHAFWSIRSGAFLLSAIAVFGLLALLSSTTGGSQLKSLLRNIIRPLFIGCLGLAAVTLFVRL
jgi:hypothetical protein